ncbi:MAG: GSCFA domain-containing protein [Bacteroidales bacterium]|nr:GSCFA domain-containing protein [Bacteroidales bacterium]
MNNTEPYSKVRHSMVEASPLLKSVLPNHRLVMLGSCFAQYMGSRMQDEGFHVTVNPLGTLFNPFSIAQTVRAALYGNEIEYPIFPADGEWRCWWANTRIRANSVDELKEMLRERYASLGHDLVQADHLIITLGTNVCYKVQHDDEWMVVTNCQRQPDRLFQEWRATVGDVVECMASLMDMLLGANPALQIILTVSPYRYHKYGYHGSQLSKATLLLAEDEIVKRYPQNCCYFPAYEILLDELRDYSFYAEDGHHPGSEAVEHIWQRFRQTAMTGQ